jgi:hypothetical protein
MIWLVLLYATMTAVCYGGSRMVNRQISVRWRMSRPGSFLLAVLWPLMTVWWILRSLLYRWGIMTQPEDMFPRR